MKFVFRTITHINKPNENTQTAAHEKNTTSDSESVNIDEKVLDRIQQLEKELIVMKDRVKNDTETIDDLKSKVLQKDKELTEFDFISQSQTENQKANKNQDTGNAKENFSKRIRVHIGLLFFLILYCKIKDKVIRIPVNSR